MILSEESNRVPQDWDHITKVDPENEKRLPAGYPFYLQHTDAISVGGSSDVTAQNTEETFSLLSIAQTPSFHEPSEARHVTEKTRDLATFLAIPEVLNGEIEALVGTLGEGIEYVNNDMIPELLESKLPSPIYSIFGEFLVDFATTWFLKQAVFEAYIVQNPESAAAQRSGVTEDHVLSPDIARQRAMVADRHLESEVIYVEYSGTYGGDKAVNVIQSIADELTRARIWYGGGIDSRERSREILSAGADTVVVGDIFHKIADEEVKIIKQALEDLDSSSSPSDIRNWVRDEINIDSTKAVQYLRTIPDVQFPESLAEQYLSLTIGLFFIANAADTEDVDTSFSRSSNLLKANFSEERQKIENTFADHDEAWNRYISDIVLPTRVSEDSEIPAHHLSFAGETVESGYE